MPQASSLLAAPRMMLRIRLTRLASSSLSAKISGFATQDPRSSMSTPLSASSFSRSSTDFVGILSAFAKSMMLLGSSTSWERSAAIPIAIVSSDDPKLSFSERLWCSNIAMSNARMTSPTTSLSRETHLTFVLLLRHSYLAHDVSVEEPSTASIANIRPSFDHLSRRGRAAREVNEAQRLRRFKIDHEIEDRRLQDRQISGLSDQLGFYPCRCRPAYRVLLSTRIGEVRGQIVSIFSRTRCRSLESKALM